MKAEIQLNVAAMAPRKNDGKLLPPNKDANSAVTKIANI